MHEVFVTRGPGKKSGEHKITISGDGPPRNFTDVAAFQRDLDKVKAKYGPDLIITERTRH